MGALVDHLAGPLTARSLPGSGVRTPLRSGERTPLRSGERTPTIAEEVSNSVDAYTDSLVCDIRGFNEVVKPEALVEAAGTSPEEIAELSLDFKACKIYVCFRLS